MNSEPVWKIQITLNGPIAISGQWNFSVYKVPRTTPDPFYSEIEVKNIAENGLHVNLTTSASTAEIAKQSGIHFFGMIVDCLVAQLNIPIAITTFPGNNKSTSDVSRVITEAELEHAYQESNLLNWFHPVFLKSYGWYRKGLTAEDPFDKFLSFWNSIEIIASKYHTSDEFTKKGVKNQIRNCFESLWGNIENWPLIGNRSDWIDDCNKLRNDIAHGVLSVSIQEVERVIREIEILQNVSFKFIKGWRSEKIEFVGGRRLRFIKH